MKTVCTNDKCQYEEDGELDVKCPSCGKGKMVKKPDEED